RDGVAEAGLLEHESSCLPSRMDSVSRIHGRVVASDHGQMGGVKAGGPPPPALLEVNGDSRNRRRGRSSWRPTATSSAPLGPCWSDRPDSGGPRGRAPDDSLATGAAGRRGPGSAWPDRRGPPDRDI